jgi:putative tryptophan/tyrosine transport system substrate-binding protein
VDPLATGASRGEAVPQLVDFIKANVALIVVGEGPLALSAKSATQTIPVFVAPGDPVDFGIVSSLSRPGGNLTGLAMIIDADFIGKWVELLKETAPLMPQVGFIHDSNMRLPTEAERIAASRLKIRYVEVRDLKDIDAMFAGMSKKRGGVVVPLQPFFSTHQRDITDLASRHRLPAIYGVRSFVDVGGLISYGLSLPDVWRSSLSSNPPNSNWSLTSRPPKP